MSQSSIDVRNVLRPSPQIWETIYEVPNDKAFKAEVILVHDLKRSDSRERLETDVRKACLASNKTTEVSFRISVYRFNYATIRNKAKFDIEVEQLQDKVQILLLNSTGINQLPFNHHKLGCPKILLIGYELGAWLVKETFAREARLWHGKSMSPETFLGRLTGTIFLGADAYRNFPYSKYLETRLSGLGNTDAAVPGFRLGPARPIDKIPLDRFSQRLLIIDSNFIEALQRRECRDTALTTWILPTPIRSSVVQSSSRNNGFSIFHNQKEEKKYSRNIFRWRHGGDSRERIQNPSREELAGEDESPETKLCSKIRIIKNLIVAKDSHILLEQVADPQDEDLYEYLHRDDILGNPGILPSSNLAEAKSGVSVIPEQLRDKYKEKAEFPEESLGGKPPPGMNQSTLPKSGSETSFTNPIIQIQKDGSWATNAEQNAMQAAQPSSDPATPHSVDISPNVSRNNDIAVDKFEKALLKFQEGYYYDARVELESLKKDTNDMVPPKLYQEITYHLSIVLMRQGDYHKAFEMVESLQKEARFQQIEGDLLGQSPLPQMLLDNLEVEVVLGTPRILGLLQGYFGHYEKAEKILENAATGCDNFIRACQDSRSLALSVTSLTPVEQSDVETFMNEDTQRKPGHLQIDTRTVRAKIDLARAEVLMLRGEEGRAFDIARSTLRSAERQFGIRHMLTLEAAFLNALILWRRFDKEAETVCTTTINAMSRHLGREHPLTMEALSTLVSIFIAQARPYEALDTISALLKQAIKKLGISHPQTLRYRCQLGNVYLEIGSYLQAKQEFEPVYEAARAKWKDQRLGEYPDVFRYLTKLATANYRIGKSSIAQEQVKEALSGQARIFREESTHARSDVDPIFEKLDLAPDPGFTIAPHPDVLESLVAYASVLSKIEHDQQYTRDSTVLDIFELVYNMRKKHYGDFHFLTLSSGVRFGITCLQRNNMSRILDLNSFFRRIYRECEESLGSNHTTTWVARLWDMFTNGYNPEPDKFKSELRVIVKEETAQLGQSHPIVLDSLVRVFAVELMLDRPADDIADLLLKQLRQPQVLEQRLMMSLELEEAVATLYCNKNQYEQGLPIFDYLEQRLKTPRLLGEVRGFEEELETFRTRVKESFRQFRDSAENLLNDEKKRSQIELAESAYRRVALLSRALYGANYHETVKAFFCLAKFLHTSRDSQKCFEGLSIVDNLLDEIDNSKAKTEGSQLWEGHTDGEATQLPIAELGQRVPRGSLHENRKDNDEGAMLDELYLDLLKFKEKFHLQWEKEGENSILEASDREETKNDI